MKEGARVKVTIRDRAKYAHGCADALDGKEGSIETIDARPMVLVRFDTPAPRWWSHQTPARAFWFPASDLTVLA